MLERVKSIFGKPKPSPELEPITPREAVYGMSRASLDHGNDLQQTERRQSVEINKSLTTACDNKDFEHIQFEKGRFAGLNMAYEATNESYQRMVQNQNNVQNSVVYDAYSTPSKNTTEALSRGVETLSVGVAKELTPHVVAAGQTGLGGAIRATASDVLKGSPETNAHLKANAKHTVISEGLLDQLKSEAAQTSSPSASNATPSSSYEPESPSASAHNPF